MLNIIKTKTFDKNLEECSSIRGLQNIMEEIMFELISSDIKTLYKCDGKRKKRLKGIPKDIIVIRYRIREYRMLYSVIQNACDSNTTIIVAFGHRKKVYLNPKNELLCKVQELRSK